MGGICCIGKKGDPSDSDYDKLEYEEGLENFNRHGTDAPEVTES